MEIQKNTISRAKQYGGFAPIIMVLAIAILGIVGYFVHKSYLPRPDNINPTASSSPTTEPSVIWKTYKANKDYGNISFEYPSTYPVSVGKNAAFFETGGQGIDIDRFDINNFDYSQDPRLTKVKTQKYYDDIVKGVLPDKKTFVSWSLDSTDRIKKTKSGKYFKISTTFGAYEVCDFKFHTLIEIPQNNNIVKITVYGNINKIGNSMNNSPLLKLWEGCNDKSFAEGGVDKFWNQLVGGGGTPEARDWFDTANRVADSLDF